MKIFNKILIPFFIVISLVMFVGFFSMNISRQLTTSLSEDERGGKVTSSADQVKSIAKETGAHLMLFLALQDPSDREQFLKSSKKLQGQMAALGEMVKSQAAQHYLTEIFSDAAKLYSDGEIILWDYDKATRSGSIYLPEKHEDVIRDLHKSVQAVVQDVDELVSMETDLINNKNLISSVAGIVNQVESVKECLMLYLTLGAQVDMQNYQQELDALLADTERLGRRLAGKEAQGIFSEISKEVSLFKTSAGLLLENYLAAGQGGGLSADAYYVKVREFHGYSAKIKTLGEELAALLAARDTGRGGAGVSMESVQRSILLVIVGGVAIALGIALIFAMRIAKPIVKLQAAAGEIEHGNLAIDIETGGNDEIGALATSLREIAGDLQRYKDELSAARKESVQVFNSFLDALFVVSPSGEYESVNSASCRLLGCREEDIVGRPFASFFDGDPPFVMESGGKDPQRFQVQAQETSYRTRDGGSQGALFSSSIIWGPGKLFKGILCQAKKISEADRSGKKQDWLATVVAQVDEAVVITDQEGLIQYVNPSFTRITGYSSRESLGQHESILRSGRHDESYYEEIEEVLARGEVWRGHFVNKKKSGSLYEEECIISPVRNKKSEIVNYVSLRRDVTNVMRLEKNLAQAQKHEALGTLAGGIAHDFNNILTAILGYTAITMSTVGRDSKAYDSLEKIVKAGRRAADLVSQILAFSRQTEHEPQPMRLQSVVKEALKLLRGTLPSTIEIRENIDAEVGAIFADVTQIHQVIMNLCTNAYHAMRMKGGVLTVSLEQVVIDPRFGPQQPDILSGTYAKLSVIDTGHGMDMATLERIFEPYFTTKGAGEGTGLGLATVQGIVESHKGTVTVQSHPGQGTTFCVYLPVYASETMVDEEKKDIDLPALSGTILFVDDEELIATMGKELLEQLGCDVDMFTSSLEALDAFMKDPQKYDVVITDQTMPRLTGIELARKLLAIRPDIPIILCTGYSESVGEKQVKAEGIREFFMKPLEVQSLAAAIKKHLPKKPGEE